VAYVRADLVADLVAEVEAFRATRETTDTASNPTQSAARL